MIFPNLKKQRQFKRWLFLSLSAGVVCGSLRGWFPSAALRPVQVHFTISTDGSRHVGVSRRRWSWLGFTWQVFSRPGLALDACQPSLAIVSAVGAGVVCISLSSFFPVSPCAWCRCWLSTESIMILVFLKCSTVFRPPWPRKSTSSFYSLQIPFFIEIRCLQSVSMIIDIKKMGL